MTMNTAIYAALFMIVSYGHAPDEVIGKFESNLKYSQQDSQLVYGRCNFRNRSGGDRVVVWTLDKRRGRLDPDWFFQDMNVHNSGQFWDGVVFGGVVDRQYFIWLGYDHDGREYIARFEASVTRISDGRVTTYEGDCEPIE